MNSPPHSSPSALPATKHLSPPAPSSRDENPLALFRSRSMPVHALAKPTSTSVYRPALSRSGSSCSSSLGSDMQDDDGEEEEEEDEIVSPRSDVHPCCSYPTLSHNFLASSLPASLGRRDAHEHATRELLQLTQPMREGVLSPAKLLLSSRMKQVGIGGRGRRNASAHSPREPAPATKPELVSLPHLLGERPSQTFEAVPLIRPRPIVAWQRPQ